MKPCILRYFFAVGILLNSAWFINVHANNYFESDYSNQIYGHKPIIESLGVVIVKAKDNLGGALGIPFEQEDGNKTDPQVGDTLYVPVHVSEAIKAKYPNAYFKGSFQFEDWDKDISNEEEMALKVEWFVIDPAQSVNDLDGLTPVLSGIKHNDLGIGYTVAPDDLGKKIVFRITPIAQTGMPRVGDYLDVLDISKLSGQRYPVDTNNKIDPNQPVISDDNMGEHPHIGSSIVQGNGEDYLIFILDKNGQRVDEFGTKVLVNSQYRAKVMKAPTTQFNGDKNDLDVSEEFKNNIVWELHKKLDNGKFERVASTGLSESAKGNLSDIRGKGTYDPMIAPGSSVDLRLDEGTLLFKTQLDNETALYQGEPNFSEQGLVLRAILVIEEKQ
ncbi:hypothetical protein [Thorsellia kenyensis]|uniref:Uncharacterized protein n=1 Tax=Thorsellia kenyensis TaxID=1549888 RepID=A0ABV6C9G2_9GAMM